MKLKLVIAFGIGYVLGAKAGRERYEEIRETAARVQADPRVQEATQRAETFAKEAAEQAERYARETISTLQEDDRVTEAAASVRESAQKVRSQATEAVHAARERISGDADDTAAAAPSPTPRTPKPPAPASDPTASSDTSPGGSSWPAHPDEHIDEPEDELVHSSGPEDDSIPKAADDDLNRGATA